MKEDLTFQDDFLVCGYIYQPVTDKIINGVIEQEEIFYKAHEILSKIKEDFFYERLEKLLFLLNMKNIQAQT